MTRLMILITGLAACAHAITYWVDDTCACSKTRSGVDDRVMGDITDMAKAGLSKLESNDDLFNGAMDAIFKLYKAKDAGKQTVRDNAKKIFTAIQGFTKAKDREGSDVRIYCDNDAYGPDKRWRLVPDADRKDGKTNSKLPFEEQEYWDYINQILRSPGDKGVQAPGTQAQTYSVKPDPDKSGQNKDRESITIADSELKDPTLGTLPEALDDYDESDPPDLSIFDEDLTLTIFHEFTHLEKVAKLPGGAKDPASWGKVNAESSGVLATAADAYTYLALSAILNDRYQWRVAEDTTEARKGTITPIGGAPTTEAGPAGDDAVDPASSTTQSRKRWSAGLGQPWLVDRKVKVSVV